MRENDGDDEDDDGEGGSRFGFDDEWIAFFVLDYPVDARSPTLVERDPNAHPYLRNFGSSRVGPIPDFAPELPEKGAEVLRFALARWAVLHPAEAQAEEARLRSLVGAAGRRVVMRTPRSALLAAALKLQRWWKCLFYHPRNFAKFGTWIDFTPLDTLNA
jgi:hypothetical protein